MKTLSSGKIGRLFVALVSLVVLPGLAGAQQPTAAPARPVIHVHHHFYYPSGDPSGDDSGDIDPGARSSPYAYSYENSAFDEMPAFDRNWGDLGFYAYLGQQGEYTGLIVSRILPDSPVSKLGLAPRDIILTINDLEVGELSYREIERLFVKLSSTPKIAVTMNVWNAHTRRSDTLKAELVNDPPQDDE